MIVLYFFLKLIGLIRYVPISALQVCFLRIAALALTADVP